MSARVTSDAAAPETAETGRLVWPGDPETVTAADIDFEALAHVLANTCRFGGRTPRYHALAAHALIASEEIEALDGLGPEDRRTLALHALLMVAPAAWLGPGSGPGQAPGAGSQGAAPARAAEPGSRLEGRDRSRSGPGRSGRLAGGIERAVREAAGLDPVLAGEHAELLRFIARMTAAAEHRDLFGGEDRNGGGVAFPPLKRRIRPMGPGRAAKLWLARFRILARRPDGDGAGAGAAERGAATGNGGETSGRTNDGTKERTNEGGDSDVADVSAKEGLETRARTRTPGGRHERKAA